MLKDILKMALTAFVTGAFAAMAASVYSLLISQVSTDDATSQQSQMVYLLTEISQKLDSRPVSAGIAARSVDLNSLKPINTEKLMLEYEKPQYYKREFFVGAKLYKTSVSLSDLSASGLQKNDIDKIDWTFDGEAISTTRGAQPLFLSKIKKPLFSFLTSEKSFDVIAQVWLNEAVAESEDIINPIELKIKLQW